MMRVLRRVLGPRRKNRSYLKLIKTLETSGLKSLNNSKAGNSLISIELITQLKTIFIPLSEDP